MHKGIMVASKKSSMHTSKINVNNSGDGDCGAKMSDNEQRWWG